MKTHEIILASRPIGRLPQPENFELRTRALPALADGQVLVRNQYFSVDPYMEERLHEAADYLGAFTLGDPLEGRCVGYVVASKSRHFQPGEAVLGFNGFRDHWIATPADLTLLRTSDAVPLVAHLGPLGNTGFTAYVGLTEVAGLKPGDAKQVFISAGAGAVGSIACQMARIFGCRVVGATGSDSKVAWLQTTAGVEAFNYRAHPDLVAKLRFSFPRGIDVYFDNVGGAHLDAALANMAHGGIATLCGELDTGHQFRHLGFAVNRRLRLTGFIAHDYHSALWNRFEAQMIDWLSNRTMSWEVTTYMGLERTYDAFCGLFSGANIGKTVVQLG